jgi:drug/metabolite transporter (DMT)-like permease
MGTVNGALFLCSFVLLQHNIRKSGVVLSSLFQRLGLLVSLAAAVLLFGELPTPLQAAGFVIALGAIVLINTGKGASFGSGGAGLLALLVLGGLGDTMSKVFETWGDSALAPQFLLYTFGAALVLCLALMLYKKQRPGRYELLFGVLIGVPNFFSARFLLRALGSLPAVIVYPTFSVATILVVTLAGVVFFGEKLTRRQWLALGAILAALVLLNI